MKKTITLSDLGRMKYREAWERQERAHERVLAGGEEEIFLVEHEPVISFGRRGETVENLKTSVSELELAGIDVVQSDRGGDVTYHGPGQIVVYPIIRLAGHGFSVGGYVHRLEGIVIGALKEMGIEGCAEAGAVGVWVLGGGGNAQHITLNAQGSNEEPPPQPSPGIPGEGEGGEGELGAAKICAIGVRIRRGVSLHGLALNVSGDLSGFSHIVPCGLAGRPVTSVERVLGDSSVSMGRAKGILARHLVDAFSA